MSCIFGEVVCLQEFDVLLVYREKIIVLDLVGDELGFFGSLFLLYFNWVCDVGWYIIVYVGEVVGLESIWQVICELGVECIGYGVKVVEDCVLMDFFVQQCIGIEFCLILNIQISIVVLLVDYLFKIFFEYGVFVSFNMDDLVVQGVDIIYEYYVVVLVVGLSCEQICQVQINGLEIVFLSDGEKCVLCEKVVVV